MIGKLNFNIRFFILYLLLVNFITVVDGAWCVARRVDIRTPSTNGCYDEATNSTQIAYKTYATRESSFLIVRAFERTFHSLITHHNKRIPLKL